MLQSIGIDFQVQIKEVDENFPPHLGMEEIPVYLAKRKATPFSSALKENDLLITAETIVWINGHVLGKPAGADEAKQ